MSDDIIGVTKDAKTFSKLHHPELTREVLCINLQQQINQLSFDLDLELDMRRNDLGQQGCASLLLISI